MADASGQQDIRGIDIDKLAKGFGEVEDNIIKVCEVSSTSAREFRYFQKTAGFLDSADTTLHTASEIANTAFGSLPTVVEQSWTRQTAYVRKYFVESPWISDEDIKDSDVDILATNVRDLVRGVKRQKSTRIYAVLSADVSNTNASNAAWNAASYTSVNIVEDIMEGKMNIYDDGYNPEGAWLLLSSLDHKSLITWLIDGKGSSIPSFASARVTDGAVMEILGLKVMVDTIVTADEAMIVVPQTAIKWKSFGDITSEIMRDPLIGKKVRVAEWGEAIMTDPAAANKITNTQA